MKEMTIKSTVWSGTDVRVFLDDKEFPFGMLSLKFDDKDKCILLSLVLADVTCDMRPKGFGGKNLRIEFATENGVKRGSIVCKINKYEGFSLAVAVDDLAIDKFYKFSLESVIDLEEED